MDFWLASCSSRYGQFNLSGLLIGKTIEVIYEEGEGPKGNFCNLQLQHDNKNSQQKAPTAQGS